MFHHFPLLLGGIIASHEWCSPNMCGSSHKVTVQSLIHGQLFETPWTAEHQASLSITYSWSLLKLMPIESVMPSKHLIPCHPLLLCLQSFPASVFSNESVLSIRLPKYLSFSFSISPFSELSGMMSFRIDWFDLLVVQGTLKGLSTPQFKNINSSALSFLYNPTLTSIHDYQKKT